MDCHSLLQQIFLTQGLNPGLLPCRQILYLLSHQGSTKKFLARGLLSCLLYLGWFLYEIRRVYLYFFSLELSGILGLGKSKNFPKGNSDKEPAALLCVTVRCQKERSAHTVGAEDLLQAGRSACQMGQAALGEKGRGEWREGSTPSPHRINGCFSACDEFGHASETLSTWATEQRVGGRTSLGSHSVKTGRHVVASGQLPCSSAASPWRLGQAHTRSEF